MNSYFPAIIIVVEQLKLEHILCGHDDDVS